MSSPLLWPWLCRHSQHWSWVGGCGWEYHGGGKLWSSSLAARWCRCPCGGPGLWLLGRSADRAAGSPHPPSSPHSGTCCWSRTHGLDLVKKEMETIHSINGVLWDLHWGNLVSHHRNPSKHLQLNIWMLWQLLCTQNSRDLIIRAHLLHIHELRRSVHDAVNQHCTNTCMFQWIRQRGVAPLRCGRSHGLWTRSVCAWVISFASLQARHPRTADPERFQVWPPPQNSPPP